MKIVAVLLAILLGLFVIGVIVDNRPGGITYAAQKTAAKFCNDPGNNAAKLISLGRESGALPGRVAGSSGEVDERAWESLPHDSKIAVTLALYCGAADRDGAGQVMLRGHHDGKVKASMTKWQLLGLKVTRPVE